MLQSLPLGSQVFVDANILVYLHVQVPPLTEEAIRFFERVESDEVVATISSHVLAEAGHRIMVAQAAEKLGIKQRDALNQLRRAREVVKSLQLPLALAETLQLPLRVEAINQNDVLAAERHVRAFGLLMNDALVLAVMQRLGLRDLVTNDDDFDGLPDVVVWKPSRT